MRNITESFHNHIINKAMLAQSLEFSNLSKQAMSYDGSESKHYKIDELGQQAQPINSGWVSVETELPEIGEVLLLIDNDDIPYLGFYNGKKEDIDFTHWIKIPASPPKQ